MKFSKIIKLSQASLKIALQRELKRLGYEPQNADGFLYANGQVPVLLVAHLDTVHTEPVKTICYSDDHNILMSPQGIGGDDRCGVDLILRIVAKLKCSVLFCEDEEIGGIGAEKFVASAIKPNVNYIIEFDRKGSNDAVYYDCANDAFEDFVSSFGFKTEYGSFSDISVIAPSLGVAAVNLSAGYYNAHTKSEYIDLSVMKRNAKRACEMISTDTAKFEYVENIRYSTNYKAAGQEPYDYVLIDDVMDYYDGKMRYIMPLLESAYIKMNDELFEGHEYGIASNGSVYELLDCSGYPIALEKSNASAFTQNGSCLQFNYDCVEEYLCIPSEYVDDFMYEIGYYSLGYYDVNDDV